MHYNGQGGQYQLGLHKLIHVVQPRHCNHTHPFTHKLCIACKRKKVYGTTSPQLTMCFASPCAQISDCTKLTIWGTIGHDEICFLAMEM